MELREILEEAEIFLVAIGEEFQAVFDELKIDNSMGSAIFEEFAKKDFLDNREKGRVDFAYERLRLFLENKNYFLITMCYDDRIYDAGLEADRIVAPCGSLHALQCEAVCTDEIYAADDFLRDISEGKQPLCPHCGKGLVMNHIGASRYSEEGYLKQWEKYTKWLQGTLNKKLCILELGVGLKYPSVVRWPAEKITYLNQKARLIRVHPSLYQLPEEIKNRGISLAEDPITFLLNQFV